MNDCRKGSRVTERMDARATCHGILRRFLAGRLIARKGIPLQELGIGVGRIAL
jgi:hypothetical protein